MAIDIEAPGGSEADLIAALQTLTGIKTKRITIPSADILTCFTTPVELIAAPGPAKMVVIICSTVVLNFNSVAYSVSAPSILWGDDIYVDPIWKDCTTILAQTDYKIQLTNSGEVQMAVWPSQAFQNQPVSFTDLENPTLGDSDLVIELVYRIVNLP